jgi:hypothetical protein
VGGENRGGVVVGGALQSQHVCRVSGLGCTAKFLVLCVLGLRRMVKGGQFAVCSTKAHCGQKTSLCVVRRRTADKNTSSRVVLRHSE